MTPLAPNQMTFNFEPALPERFPTLRAYVAHRASVQSKPMKVIAADMDMSPSTLSRKLNPGEADSQRFNLDDLEGYLGATGDASAVIEYIAAKYMDSPEARKTRAISRLESLAGEMERAMASLRSAA